MKPHERDSIGTGRRVQVNIRGRVFFARVTGRDGDDLTLDPEQPRPGTKGSRVTHYSCDIGDVEWAEKNTQWSPYDAVRK